MTKNAIIILIAICSAAIVAGAAVAAITLGNSDNSSVVDIHDDPVVTVTGVAMTYDGGVASNNIYVTCSNVKSVSDKIGAVVTYSDNSTKKIADFTKTSTLSDNYAAGDKFTITVTYGTYSASTTFWIMEDGAPTVVITCESGTNDCYNVELNTDGEYTITFSGITEDSIYSIAGALDGNIVVDVGDDYKFELSLECLTIKSSYSVPIDIESADKVTLSAKKDTINVITDNRSAVDESGISASIYSLVDLDIEGKGTLSITSVNNNGIHTKDDLSVKNLTLRVECKDNALKGNDSVTIQSGMITLIAKTGDGIKTTNSDVSKKGVQRGIVTINSDKGDLILDIYAACDGIDASYDVIIRESDAGTVTLNIVTDKYSSYSETTAGSGSDKIYLRTIYYGYTYSLYLMDSNSNGKWVNAVYKTSEWGMGREYHYYTATIPSGYTQLKVYTYTSSQTQGQSESYYSVSKQITINTDFNMLILPNLNWSTYGGDRGGMPMDEGNTDKGEYSTKGIKADNSVDISGGTINVKSYDDAIHVNGEVALENGATSIGVLSISGGKSVLYSNDDGIHGDGSVTISGGTVSITKSFEGIEGSSVTISGGDISVISSDDGINGTSTSGTAISVSGGKLYIYAGGDGMDSNSRTTKVGIIISGGNTMVISSGNGDSSIDTENGWRYTGGRIIAICAARAMTQEVTNCDVCAGSMAKKTYNTQVSSGTVYSVSDSGNTVSAVKMPCSLNGAFIAYLGGTTTASISSTGDSFDFDSNGVYWK